MEYMKWIWLVAIAGFIATEAATTGLVCIWFALGSVAGLLASLAGIELTGQIVIFAVVSAIALAVTRPLVKALSRRKAVPTNLDRVIGTAGKVMEAIDNQSAAGTVYAGGKLWTARSVTGDTIPAGTMVKVERMEGVKLFVIKSEEKAEVRS